MPRRAAQRKPEEDQAPLPEVLTSPSKVEPHQRDAYWLHLLETPEEFKAAVQTEEPWSMLKSFPESIWGNRLSLFIYRLPDEDGLMLKNAEGQAKYIKPVVRFCIDEDWVATKHGGGKYQFWLKLDETVIRKHTFRIDGEPKMMAGQRVELDGKAVSVGAPAATPTAERSELAQVLDASKEANKAALEGASQIVEIGGELLKKQLGLTPQPENTFQNKLLDVLLTKALEPPPAPPNSMADALAIVDKLDSMAARRNPAPAAETETKDTPIEETLGAIEKLTGGRSLIDLLKPAAKAAAEENPWALFAGVAQSFVASLPSLMAEFRQTRLIEMRNRDLQWRRDLWARNAKQGEQPPPDLMGEQVALPPAQPPARPQPVNAPAAPSAADPNALINAVVGLICQGFDNSPYMGEQTAGAIDLLYGRALEHLGVTAILANETELDKYIAGVPALAQRSQFATWKTFKGDFLRYTVERWSEEPDDDNQKAAGPQPVA
jgi:hypothetical protein